MNKLFMCKGFAVAVTVALMSGCAGVRPIPDPRDPAPVRDSPELLRVCVVNGDGAHLAVGDQVEITTNQGGRLSIRHLPGPNNRDGAWNDGKAISVRAAVLVQMISPRDNQKNSRRFVPVGRFKVRVGGVEHAPFDFSTSKATANLANNRFPECNVDLGADEVLIRGVKDAGRHGGDVVLR